MPFKRISWGLAALIVCFSAHFADAQAANTPGISQKVASCDYNYPTRCQAVGAGADSSAFLNMSTATTTQIVGLVAGKRVYVSSFDVIAAGATNAKFVYGTGANCGTGTTDLTANWNLAAQAGVARGNGGAVLFSVPAGNALCVVNSAAVVLAVNVSYAQF